MAMFQGAGDGDRSQSESPRMALWLAGQAMPCVDWIQIVSGGDDSFTDGTRSLVWCILLWRWAAGLWPAFWLRAVCRSRL